MLYQFFKLICRATYIKFHTSIHTDNLPRRLISMGRKISSDIVHTVDPNSEVSEVLPVFLTEESYKILCKSCRDER